MSEMADPLRLGIVGAGFTGVQAARSCGPLARVDAVCIADPNDDRRQHVVEEYDIPRAYRDYRDILDDDEVDAVYYGVPPDIRLPMILDGFAAGKHALVQKPHGTGPQQILELDAAAKKADLTLQFSYFFRHFIDNRRMRAAAQRGRIGRLYHGRIFNRSAHPPAFNNFDRWLYRYENKGGPLGQHFSHDLDLMWWLMGCPKPRWAFAIKHTLPERYEGEAENYLSGLVGLEGDRTIEISCSDVDQSQSPKVFALYGTEGTITGDDPKRAASRGDDKAIFRFRGEELVREEIVEDLEEEDGLYTDSPGVEYIFYRELEHFALAIAGEVEPEVSAAEAYDFMTILDALLESALKQEKVTIN